MGPIQTDRQTQTDRHTDRQTDGLTVDVQFNLDGSAWRYIVISNAEIVSFVFSSQGRHGELIAYSDFLTRFKPLVMARRMTSGRTEQCQRVLDHLSYRTWRYYGRRAGRS